MKNLLMTLGLVLGCLISALAQPVNLVDTDRFAFGQGANMDPDLMSPGQFLGYELGQRMTLYAHVVDYFEQLGASSDRVLINKYGETYEGRPLINLVISSEEHIARIEDIRKEHLQLITAAPQEAAAMMEDAPVFTSFSYNIHGNEFSSTEAAMQVAYHLAAARDAGTENVLDNSVIIMYICINPDGRDRYAYWYNSVARQRTPGVEPSDLEHFAPWPNGRTNHYWFDLNRDWVWGVHPESRGHTAEYQRWMPQVHVDYHEQGYNNNYFTMPGTTPRNLLLPDRYEAWSDTFGMANVRAFDRHQLNYFTREAFDFFYPGYGSSYPSVMGAIGMLCEQGGIGGGLGIETNDGYVLTLRQRIFDHYTTSLATIRKSAEHRKELLQYSYEAWQPANAKSTTKAYFFSPESPYASDVVNVLLHHGVTVRQATAAFKVNGARDFRLDKASDRTFPPGTYIVDAQQPKALFIHSIMDRNLAIEDSVMYDMATWSAPLAYNLDAWYTNGSYQAKSEEVGEALRPAAGMESPAAQYAFVIEWRQRNAPRALALLWEKGYRVRTAEEGFRNGTHTFGAGSLIVLRGRNLEKTDRIEADMQAVAAEAGVRIVGMDSGRMLEGNDLASGSSRPLKQPKVALMVEPPFDTYTGGQLYFLFDQETRLPVERIRASILQQTALPKFGSRYGYADLNDYDVLILPGGGLGLTQLFEKEQIATLRDWISRGGVVVACESAAAFFTEKASGLTKVQQLTAPEDTSRAVKYLAYADREDYFGKKRIPGSAVNTHIDTTHPLAFGMDEDLYGLKFDNSALQPSGDLQTVGYYRRDPGELLVAGYASRENLQHLAGGAWAGVVNVGQGKVVFLLDNTQYRMFWRGPSRMVQNAVMLLPGF